jgi:hypothetical protein
MPAAAPSSRPVVKVRVARLVKPNETVTVQGRFERGFLHASVIQHEDGSADLVGPPKGPPPHGVMARLRDAVRP